MTVQQRFTVPFFGDIKWLTANDTYTIVKAYLNDFVKGPDVMHVKESFF